MIKSIKLKCAEQTLFMKKKCTQISVRKSHEKKVLRRFRNMWEVSLRNTAMM
jgi:hypothetical protein